MDYIMKKRKEGKAVEEDKTPTEAPHDGQPTTTPEPAPKRKPLTHKERNILNLIHYSLVFQNLRNKLISRPNLNSMLIQCQFNVF